MPGPQSTGFRKIQFPPTHLEYSLIPRVSGLEWSTKEFVILIFISRILCALPIGLLLRLGRLLGLVWYYLLPVRVGVARQNVERVYGDSLSPARKRQIVRRSCQNLTMTILEGFRLPILKEPREASRIETRGMELLREPTERGQGGCLVSLHLGNFELAVGTMATQGLPIHIIYKDINWKSAHNFWNLVRQTTGVSAIAPRRSKNRIKEVLAQGGLVGFAADQHMPPHRGIVCEFMGQLASTTPAPCRFALETQTPILFAYTYRQPEDPTRHVFQVESFEIELPHDSDAENIRHNSQRLNDRIAEVVKTYPEQWLWQHKRFKVQDNPEAWQIPTHLQKLTGT